VAIWIFNRGLDWEILEPNQHEGRRFAEFSEALRVGEHLAALLGHELLIHFRPLANPGPPGSSWS